MAERPLVSPTVARLPQYQAGRSIEEVKRAFGLDDVVKLASNESAFGPSQKALEAIARASADVARYPDDGHALRSDLAARLGVGAGQVVLGAGATDLIELCVRTFATAGGHAVISAGSFVAYRLFLDAADVRTTETPLSDWAIDLDAIADATHADTQLVFLPNPNNPTGSRFGAAALERLVTRLPRDVVLVLDDAYIDYHDASDVPDTIEVMRRRERTVVLRSFSKAHGLAGLRVGYAVTPEPLAEALRRVHRPFGVSRVGSEAARASLADEAHLSFTREQNQKGRAALASRLTALGFSVLPSQANFVTARLKDAPAASRLAQALLERGAIVRPLGAFGLPSCVRISVGTPAELERLFAALLAVLEREPALCRVDDSHEDGAR